MFEQDLTEFFCSYEDSRFDAHLMGKESDEPWVQLCVTGDDMQDLNLNLSLDNAKKLQAKLQEFLLRATHDG